ncbi:MAG TPA: amidohydrolase family protein [Solirubrobacteraceae bacterium]|nr:amidohydrolase family protein [Solirubrobacteraceae bacterium]
MRIDVHQHLWSEPLLDALSRRRQPPCVRDENGLTMLHLAGERPCVLELGGESPRQRARLVERDGLDRALICLSSALGIESLEREQAEPLLEAYHEGALSLGPPFGVWGAVALDRQDPLDVDRVLDRSCVGVSLPASALADVASLTRVGALLERLEARDAPLLVHPGPAGLGGTRGATLRDPLWWPAMTDYVAGMHAAWLAFLAVGRRDHPRLRVVFAMLAGLAPIHEERLAARGGSVWRARDPLLFYETSSYGPGAIRAMARAVGREQLLYGSDRPVVQPPRFEVAERLAPAQEALL